MKVGCESKRKFRFPHDGTTLSCPQRLRGQECEMRKGSCGLETWEARVSEGDERCMYGS